MTSKHHFIASPVRLPLFALLGISLFITSCTPHKPPKVDFATVQTPEPPNYRDLKYWAAHPDKKDPADQTPIPELADRQDEAFADVFFIHPTTFNDPKHWNGDLSDEDLNQKTDETTIKHQASVFNGSCRVYAPRYRQMTYRGFFADSTCKMDAFKAFTIAYQDVQTAFEYYLENENKGRPFFIASHSQGTAHAIHLIRDYVDGKKLPGPMIAAYLVGWPVPADTFSTIRPCDGPLDSGCFTSWCTFAEGHTPENFARSYRNAVCTNPVTWSLDQEVSDPELHEGTVLKGYNKVYGQALRAQVHNSILWITKPDVPGKIFYNFKNYHIADYNLFWMDIRNNLEERLVTYRAAQRL